MKKILKIIIVIFLALLFILPVAIFLITTTINDSTAAGIKEHLLNIPLPDNTELCDAASIAGKLIGNGNGMQYLGMILIQSDLTISEIRDYYANYQDDTYDYLVDLPQDLEQELYIKLPFTASISNDSSEEYYVVYSWGWKLGISPFDEIDLRGH